MRITGLRTAAVNVPFDIAAGVGSGTLRSAGIVLTWLETDEGLVGEGLAFSLNANRLAVLHDLVRSFEPLLIGLDLALSGSFGVRARRELRGHGVAGFSSTALAAVENALFDLRGKTAGLNVAALLGACRATIPAYNSAGLWVDCSIDDLQRRAADHIAHGFRAMKMRLVGDPRIDVPRVRAMRDAIGPDIGLMADANQGMSVPDAIRLGHALEEFHLAWLEEPVAAHDHAGEARIAAALDTPIASGESVYTSRAVHDMLKLGSVDVLMPDLQRMGGPAEFLKAAALAEAYDIPVSGHLFPEMSIGLLAAIPNASTLEYMPWVSAVYRETVVLNGDGEAIVPFDRPGWGYAFDQDAIQRLRA